MSELGKTNNKRGYDIPQADLTKAEDPQIDNTLQHLGANQKSKVIDGPNLDKREIVFSKSEEATVNLYENTDFTWEEFLNADIDNKCYIGKELIDAYDASIENYSKEGFFQGKSVSDCIRSHNEKILDELHATLKSESDICSSGGSEILDFFTNNMSYFPEDLYNRLGSMVKNYDEGKQSIPYEFLSSVVKFIMKAQTKLGLEKYTKACQTMVSTILDGWEPQLFDGVIDSLADKDVDELRETAEQYGLY